MLQRIKTASSAALTVGDCGDGSTSAGAGTPVESRFGEHLGETGGREVVVCRHRRGRNHKYDRPPTNGRNRTRMLDQLRRDIQTRIDQLLSEAEKLRHALAALGSHESTTPPTAAKSSSPTRSRRRASSAAASRTPTRKSARPRPSAKSATAAASPEPAESQVTASSTGASTAARRARGATKTAVLVALANGTAMTAGEVARATGLGRATVSTTLSKLAKSGEVTKATRGYRISRPRITPPAVTPASSADDQQPVT